jgi:cyanophycin synthetase
MLVEMAALCNGEVIYFSLDPELPVIRKHCLAPAAEIKGTQGNRAVMVRDGKILLVTGSSELSLGKVADIPLTRGGHAVPEVENVLAAVGAAWALGIEPTLIRAGIEDFAAAQ